MAEVKTKSVAGMSQAEITIVEEKLSMVHGILPVEIAGALSNRFDKILDEMNANRSQLAYVENKIPGKSLEVKKQRIKKIADINNKKDELQAKRQKAIAAWHKKVLAYIEEVYGKPIKSETGLITAYGEEGRIEVKKNRHLKKLW
jgi:hypothetical protein